MSTPRDHVVLLVGGVGGAKLALGLAHALPPGALTVIVNTADDFEHLGLHVSPDLDTVMYTLAGLANPDTGWGLTGDTFRAMEMVARYGGPDWFNLGDRDLGTSLVRTALLREGHPLSAVTERLSRALGIQHPILPMSDDPVRTWLDTDQGPLPFQVYFVRERWGPVVRRVRFEGAESAQPNVGVSAALEAATLIVYGPSNPFLSIDPILSVPGIRECRRLTCASRGDQPHHRRSGAQRPGGQADGRVGRRGVPDGDRYPFPGSAGWDYTRSYRQQLARGDQAPPHPGYD